jgi:hypothetical protein
MDRRHAGPCHSGLADRTRRPPARRGRRPGRSWTQSFTSPSVSPEGTVYGCLMLRRPRTVLTSGALFGLSVWVLAFGALAPGLEKPCERESADLVKRRSSAIRTTIVCAQMRIPVALHAATRESGRSRHHRVTSDLSWRARTTAVGLLRFEESTARSSGERASGRDWSATIPFPRRIDSSIILEPSCAKGARRPNLAGKLDGNGVMPDREIREWRRGTM